MIQTWEGLFAIFTLWITHDEKFQDFYIIQILREINFGESRSSKTAVFAIFGAVHFVDLVNCSLQNLQKFIKILIQSL